jgi:hypothetical protein
MPDAEKIERADPHSTSDMLSIDLPQASKAHPAEVQSAKQSG